MARGHQRAGNTEDGTARAGRGPVAIVVMAGVLVVALGLAVAAYFAFRDAQPVVNLTGIVPDFRSVIIAITASRDPLSSKSVGPTHTLDLESGTTGTGTAADLWWHFRTRTDRSLDTRNGALMAFIAGRDFDSSDAAFLSRLRYTLASLGASGDGAQVKSGTLIAVRTAEGNYARVRVVSVGGPGDEIKLEWVLFRVAAGGGAKTQVDPTSWKRKLEAGLAAYRNKHPVEAERLYAEALADAEKFGAGNVRVGLVLSRSGSLYWSMGKLDLAESALRRAVEIIDPLTQGEIVAQLGSEEAFLAERAHSMLGVVYSNQDRNKEAARHFEYAAGAASAVTGVREGLRDWTVASNLYQLAMAHCKLGRLDEAREALQKARRANPKHPSVAPNLQMIDRLADNIARGRPCNS